MSLMNRPSEAELYRLAVEVWGEPAQMMMVVEEAAELILAVARKSRGRADVAELAEECADLEIMLGQVRHMIGSDVVDHFKRRKLARLESRLRAVEARQRGEVDADTIDGMMP